MTDVVISGLTDTVIANQQFLESGIGLEPASRAARMLLVSRLNEQIDLWAERWRQADLALQDLGMDPGVGQVDVTHVAPENFHEGPHRSLAEQPPEAFPNVSVMAYMTVPSPSQFIDQAESSEITLFIETMAISGPVPDGLEVAHETIVHRRIQRMTEAVAMVVSADTTLLGTVHQMRTPPRGGVGNSSWIRRKDKGAGERYIWHGSRLEYTLQRHHKTF